MRPRLALASAVLLASTLLTSAPVLANPEDHEGKYAAVMTQQWAEFAELAGNAPENSSAPLSFAPCVRGMAAGTFPCQGIDLLSFVPHGLLGTTFVNDIWGWTDRQTLREYALVGASEGTVFVDVTDPIRPSVLGILPTHTTAGGDFWRDIKVFEDHAFVVSENSGHGLQVFDLTQLRNWGGTYTTYAETAHYAGFGNAHNLNINEDTGFAYAVGSGQNAVCTAGLHMVDIGTPASPTYAGCWSAHGYIHDTECVVYSGPDAEHRGSEICFNSNPAFGNRVTIVDVSNKAAPVSLGLAGYANSGYSHQGWLTPDQRFFLHGDELDEVSHGINTTTRIWDVSDLESPQLIGVFENDTTSIDHNIYTSGRVAFASNYTSGLRLYDTRAVASGQLSELGYFDVYPENDNASFEGGTWSNYAFFRRPGVVAVSSMDRGMFMVRVHTGLGNN